MTFCDNLQNSNVTDQSSLYLVFLASRAYITRQIWLLLQNFVLLYNTF